MRRQALHKSALPAPALLIDQCMPVANGGDASTGTN